MSWKWLKIVYVVGRAAADATVKNEERKKVLKAVEDVLDSMEAEAPKPAPEPVDKPVEK